MVCLACQPEVVLRLIYIKTMKVQVQSVDIGVFVHHVHDSLDSRTGNFRNPVKGTGEDLERPALFFLPLRDTVGELVQESFIVLGIVILEVGIPVLPHRLVAHHQQGDVLPHVERLEKKLYRSVDMFARLRADFRDKAVILSERNLQAEHEFHPVPETGLGGHELPGKGI